MGDVMSMNWIRGERENAVRGIIIFYNETYVNRSRMWTTTTNAEKKCVYGRNSYFSKERTISSG